MLVGSAPSDEEITHFIGKGVLRHERLRPEGASSSCPKIFLSVERKRDVVIIMNSCIFSPVSSLCGLATFTS